jgi:hypothetical protein
MGAIFFCGYNGSYNCWPQYWLLWLPGSRSGASVSSTSQVRAFDVLLLQTVGIKVYQQGKSSNGIIFMRSFIQIRPIILDM